jgi:hypothetical protein
MVTGASHSMLAVWGKSQRQAAGVGARGRPKRTKCIRNHREREKERERERKRKRERQLRTKGKKRNISIESRARAITRKVHLA